MDSQLSGKLNQLLGCSWLERLAAMCDGKKAEVSDQNFDAAFKYSNYILRIINSGLNNSLASDDEKKLFDNVVYAIKASFENNNYHRKHLIYSDLLTRLTKQQFMQLVVEQQINMSDYYSSMNATGKDDIIQILSNCNFGEEHDQRLIYGMKDFFYNDSLELRMIIYDHPQIYDKLAKIGNKPNFSNEVLKELIYVHGSRYFVSRLHESLKDDDVFMQHIIMENTENIFRGRSDHFKQRIRENAFFLFGDQKKTFLETYGMEYILDHSKTDFIDFGQYLKCMWEVPKFIADRLEKIVTQDEYNNLLLRGVLDEKFYDNTIFSKTKDFKSLLKKNLRTRGYPYDDSLLGYIEFKYGDNIQKSWSPEFVMTFVDNIAASFANNTVSYFDELIASNQNNISVLIDMNILSKENIDKIGIDNLKKIAYYSNSLYILSQIIKEDSVDIFSTIVNKHISSTMAPAIDVNVLLYSSYMYKDAIIDLIEKEQLTEENVSKLINITKNNKLLKIRNSSDIINYEENLSKFCDEQIELCQDTNYAKELLFAKLLKTNRANAQDFILKFKDGLKEKNSYNFELLEALQIIDSITDIDAIKMAYNFLKKQHLFQTKDFDELQKKVKLEICGEKFIDNSEIKNDETNVDLKKHFEELGIELIVPQKESDFKILVHVMGAYGDTPEKEDVFQSWNTAQRDNVSGICTSLITNKHITTAKIPDDAVVFGFKDVKSEEVLMCAPYDIFSRNARIMPDSIRRQSYLSSDSLPDYCRGVAGDYSEVVIPRYQDGVKRQPDYIVLFDYQKKYGASLEAAKKFNVPLVYIDTKQMFQDRVKENDRLMEELYRNPTVESLIEYLKDSNSIKHGFSSVPEEHLGISYRNISKLDIHYNWVEAYEKIAKGCNRTVSETDKKRIKEFLDMERKKETPKHYIQDREETVKSRKKASALSLFTELRKKYGVSESLKITKLQSAINSIALNEKKLIETAPLEGGKKNGTK